MADWPLPPHASFRAKWAGAFSLVIAPAMKSAHAARNLSPTFHRPPFASRKPPFNPEIPPFPVKHFTLLPIRATIPRVLVTNHPGYHVLIDPSPSHLFHSLCPAHVHQRQQLTSTPGFTSPLAGPLLSIPLSRADRYLLQNPHLQKNRGWGSTGTVNPSCLPFQVSTSPYRQCAAAPS